VEGSRRWKIEEEGQDAQQGMSQTPKYNSLILSRGRGLSMAQTSNSSFLILNTEVLVMALKVPLIGMFTTGQTIF
jgi:hypothetical protein